MKPLKLVMNAFGSFLETTEIDFETLNNSGFYLITGETGSGKTTIFDAVIFALYGKASGNIRESEGFRNDLADDKTKTYVEFTFKKDNIIYKVTRSPKYSVESRTTPYNEIAQLEYGNEVIERKKAVDDKIQEIIGLTVDQFRQVIMLAQGEFMKLIISDSKEKDKIFRKIFGTELLEEISNLLKEETKIAKDKLIQIEIKLTQLMETLKTTTQLASLEASLIDYYNVEYLLKELKEKNNLDEEQLTSLNEQLTKLSDKLIILVKQEEVANILNNDFDKLNSLIEELKTLENTQTTINEYKEKIQLLNKIEQIKPLYDNIIQVHLQIQKITNLCNQNKTTVDEAYNDLNCYEEQINMIELDRLNLQKLTQEASVIKTNIELKEKVNTLLNDLDNVTKELEENETKLSTLMLDKNNNLNDIKIFEETLTTFDTVKTQYELAKADKTRIEQDYQSFLDKITILDKRNQLEEKILTETKTYQTLAQTYQNLFNDYNKKELAYFKNIAGILAEELTDNTPCPVCGSLEHPIIAIKSDDVISKDELDALAQNLEQARVNKETQALAIESLQTQCVSFNNQLLELLNINDITLIEETINKKLQSIKTEIETLNSKITNLETTLHQLEEVRQNLIAKQTHLKEIDELITKETQNQISLKEDYASINGSISTYSKEIIYEESIEELTEILDQYSAVIETMEEVITGFDDGHKLADETYKVAKAKLEENTKQLDSLKQSYEELTNKYFEQANQLELEKEILDNMEDYLLELSNLVEYTRIITEFASKYENTINLINDLQIKLQGKEKQNIEELQQQINALTIEIETTKQIISNLDKTLSINIQTYKDLSTTFKLYVKAQKEFNDINELSKTSSGNNAKYISFERYILFEYFENILKHANIRLSKMTGGRFVLYRKEDKGKGTRQQGLEIEVFDFETGKRRDIRTLSGGETFKAALSLALGLADAIENKVGHISIETLFIDEGFGTLDEKSLHQAIDILLELNDGTKSIGIISHVQELKEMIPTKLVVTKNTDGSKVKIVS